MQSIVFETAMFTNENMLVCAPTGAGKTDIALMAILQTLKFHLDYDALLAEVAAGAPLSVPADTKVIYIAPMKALAAEIVAKFSKRLGPLSLHVRELTGDMQLTRTEIARTHVIVTTPEKWDVVSRKSSGDVGLVTMVKLLIIDEVHLLHDDRGPVLEAVVARTQRQVETQQSMIRLVGLSATLPNYQDVAAFLRVNAFKGLFYFDNGFRPVPLAQHFVGVKTPPPRVTPPAAPNADGAVPSAKAAAGKEEKPKGAVKPLPASMRLANAMTEVCYDKV